MLFCTVCYGLVVEEYSDVYFEDQSLFQSVLAELSPVNWTNLCSIYLIYKLK